MDILIAYLHETAFALLKELAQATDGPADWRDRSECRAPGVAKGACLPRFSCQVLVPAIPDLPAVHEGLEIQALADAVGRIYVDGLHLAVHAVFLEHAVAGDYPVRPVVRVPVEPDGLPKRRILLRRGEQRRLRIGASPLAHRLDDGGRVDAVVKVQRDRRHLERRILGFAGPGKLRVQVRILGVDATLGVPVCVGGDESQGRVVPALLAGALRPPTRASKVPGRARA